MGDNKLTTDLQTSVEYLRGYDPNRDGTSSEFLKHMANVARAYLAENDPTPLTIEDVERMLGVTRHEDMEIVFLPGVEFEKQPSGYGIGVWTLSGGWPSLFKTITTHGEFRTFCRLFKIEVKQ